MPEIRLTGTVIKVLASLLRAGVDGAYGNEIAQRAAVSKTRIYDVLARLEKAEWATSEWEDANPSREKRPRRRIDRLTSWTVRSWRVEPWSPMRRPSLFDDLSTLLLRSGVVEALSVFGTRLGRALARTDVATLGAVVAIRLVRARICGFARIGNAGWSCRLILGAYRSGHLVRGMHPDLAHAALFDAAPPGRVGRR